MKFSNRRSQQPYVHNVPIQNGGDGFYIFVPTSALGMSASKTATPREGSFRSKGTVLTAPSAVDSTTTEVTAMTFREVAEEWFDVNQERWVESYRVRLRSRLDEDLMTAFGPWRISDIRPLDLLSAMRKIEERGAVETAKRILNMASSVFRYGVATGRCLRDPTPDIKGALRPPARPKRR